MVDVFHIRDEAASIHIPGAFAQVIQVPVQAGIERTARGADRTA